MIKKQVVSFDERIIPNHDPIARPGLNELTSSSDALHWYSREEKFICSFAQEYLSLSAQLPCAW